MLVSKISIKNFRNLDIVFAPNADINILLGQNGAGKSNFLDALYYCAYARSFRKYESLPVNWESKLNFASIELEIDHQQAKTELKLVFTGSDEQYSKQYFYNGKSTTVRKFRSLLTAILFAPYNINLLSGTPDVRRDEFDQFLGQINDHYLTRLKEYRTIVRNRNSLLAEINKGNASPRQLEFWNEKLVNLGAEVLSTRIQLLRDLEPYIRRNAQVLSHTLQDLNIVYTSKLDVTDPEKLSSVFMDKLTASYDKELRAQMTLYGPHRDDYTFIADARNLQLAGSRGQQRIAALMTKLAMWQLLKEHRGVAPLLLLDDVFSELDVENRQKLQTLVKDLEVQTFISATESDHFEEYLLKRAKIVELKSNE